MKAIVDCNSFYCSCERAFRPDLWNKPVVVLSNNDGCIVSEGLFEQGRAYKKAGVMLSSLVPDSSIQGNLFSSHAVHEHRHLMHTVDNINFSMRDDCVKFGSSGMNKNWKMRQELRSPRFSTRWEDLKEVK